MKQNIGKIVTQFSHGIDFGLGTFSRQFSYCEAANWDNEFQRIVFVAKHDFFCFCRMKNNKDGTLSSDTFGGIGDAIQNNNALFLIWSKTKEGAELRLYAYILI